MPSLACPPRALLHDLACGRVPPNREADLDAHLLACDSCAELHNEYLRPFLHALRGLSTAGSSDTPLRPELIERLQQYNPAQRTIARPPDSSVPPGAQEAPAPVRLGKFELLGELGRGGMGCVYKAHDEILARDVALKVILLADGRSATAAQRRNLFTEAQAAAKLKHPNIVPVYEAGEFENRPYLAMPLLDGETLAARLKRGPLAFAEVCAVGAQVADGLAAAHDAGLLHRDIKPANLWLERLKSGAERAVILDFGLARPVEDAAGIAGTPAYMAPEQAKGDPLTPRADLFSLGVVLFEALTGKKLFPGDNRSITNLLASVKEFAPPPVAKLLPGVPSKLAAVVGGLLRADPAKRKPATAHELAVVLASLADELAPGRTRRRLFRLVRTAALICAGGIVVAGIFQLKRTMIDAPVALKRTPQPKEEKPDATAPNGLLLPAKPEGLTIPLSLVDGKSAKTLDQLDRLQITPEAAKAAGDGDPRRVPLEVVAVLCASGNPGTDDGHTSSVEAVALHPNGAILATGGIDHTVRLWDLSGTAPVQIAVLRNHKSEVHSLAFTTDGKWLASGAADGGVVVWRFGSDEPARRFEAGAFVPRLATSRTGALIALGHDAAGAGSVRLLDLETNRDRVIPGNRDGHSGMAFTDGDRRIVIGSRGWLRVIDLTDGTELFNQPEPKVWFAAVAVSPDDTKMLANGYGTVGALGVITPGVGNNKDVARQNALSVRDRKNGWATLNILKHDGRAIRGAFTSDGKHVVSLTDDAVLHLWRWSAELKLATIPVAHVNPAHHALGRDMVLHPDGRHAIVSRDNGQVYVVRFDLKP